MRWCHVAGAFAQCLAPSLQPCRFETEIHGGSSRSSALGRVVAVPEQDAVVDGRVVGEKAGQREIQLPPCAHGPHAGHRFFRGQEVSDRIEDQFHGGGEIAVKVTGAVDVLEWAGVAEQQADRKVGHEIGVVAEPKHRYTDPAPMPASPTRGEPNV